MRGKEGGRNGMSYLSLTQLGYSKSAAVAGQKRIFFLSFPSSLGFGFIAEWRPTKARFQVSTYLPGNSLEFLGS